MEWCPHCGENLASLAPFEFGNVEILGSGTIMFEGSLLELPRTLFSVADSIIRGRGRGLTVGLLAERLGSDVFDESIKKYVERLRTSFRAIDPEFDQIETMRGFGAYRWRVEHAGPTPAYASMLNARNRLHSLSSH